MGTCYYLIRRDTRTAYGLGKAYFLNYVFGGRPGVRCDEGSSMCVSASDVDTLVALMTAAERGDLEELHDVTIHRPPEAFEDAYWRKVAIDIVDWAEGQPFEFHSEHSGLCEEISMDAWDVVPWRHRLWQTGDRHNIDGEDPVAVRWENASREAYARRRRDDEAFRRGNVWIDRATRAEVVQTTSTS